MFIVFRIQFVCNMFQCNISTSTEALLGLCNDDVAGDVFDAYKEILNGYNYWLFDCGRKACLGIC